MVVSKSIIYTMEITKETLHRIKEIRKAKRISSDKLGELIGLSGSAIRNIEAGRRKIKLETLEKIAQALGVSVAELLANPEDEKKDPEKEIEKVAWLIIEEALARAPDIKVTDRDKRKVFKILVKKLKEMEDETIDIFKLLTGS